MTETECLAAALGPHLWKDRPRHADIAEELEAPARHPFLVGQGEEIAAPDRARIVHEYVEPSEPLHGRRGGALDAFKAAEIRGDRLHRLPRLASDRPRRLVERGGAPRADHDAGALGRHGARRCPTYAFAATGDENGLALEPEFHASQ